MQPLTGQHDRFADWLAEHAGLTGAAPGRMLTGGNANVTRLVETDQGMFVLRHPPADVVSDKAAAGISREYAALSALQGRAPVPRPIAYCDDASILGQPFSLTEWVDGVAITDSLPSGYGSSTDVVDALGIAMVEGLADVHRLDWNGLLPANFGRPDGFVLRQIDRWTDVRARDNVRELPLLESVAQWLRDNLPPLAHASIIHCDFHLDNCLVSRERPELRAILDWEMATLGDPRVDLGLALFFWRRDASAPKGFPRIQAVSNHPDAVSREALAERWSKRSGISHDRLDYFVIFSAWRLAAIVEGAYALYRRGKVDSDYARGLESDVPDLLREAAELIEQGRA